MHESHPEMESMVAHCELCQTRVRAQALFYGPQCILPRIRQHMSRTLECTRCSAPSKHPAPCYTHHAASYFIVPLSLSQLRQCLTDNDHQAAPDRHKHSFQLTAIMSISTALANTPHSYSLNSHDPTARRETSAPPACLKPHSTYDGSIVSAQSVSGSTCAMEASC